MIRGIIRRTDDLGRLVIPAEIRQGLGIEPGTPLEIMVRGTTILIEVASNRCKLCGKSLVDEDTQICAGCRHRIKLGLE